MNYHQAQELLERVKYGFMAPIWMINRALELTGDLDDEDDWVLNYGRAQNPYAPMPSSGSNPDEGQGPKQGI